MLPHPSRVLRARPLRHSVQARWHPEHPPERAQTRVLTATGIERPSTWKGSPKMASACRYPARLDFFLRAITLRADQRESAAGEMCDLIGLWIIVLESICDMSQQQIARSAPEGVVDDAQPLDVHHDSGVAGTAAGGTGDKALDGVRRTGDAWPGRSANRNGTGNVPSYPAVCTGARTTGCRQPPANISISSAPTIFESRAHSTSTAMTAPSMTSGQNGNRPQAGVDHQRIEVHRGRLGRRIAADEFLACPDDLADDTGFASSRLRHIGAQLLCHLVVDATPGHGLHRRDVRHLGRRNRSGKSHPRISPADTSPGAAPCDRGSAVPGC